MSLRLEMLQIARLAPKLLGDSTGLIRGFLASQLNQDGGFKDRAGQSDLYYTVFGLEALLALQVELPSNQVRLFLNRFRHGESLDFVHLCCLARCWAALREAPGGPEFANLLLSRLESFRARDGGYQPAPGSDFGTAYGAFLAVGAYQDCGRTLPNPEPMLESLAGLRTPDGGWSNDRNLKTGSTNATAAAVGVLRQLGRAAPAQTADWLLARAHLQGGFRAAPNAPIPDLLSTATALHALSSLQRDFSSLREPCLDFLDSLWTNSGAFHGHWSDDHLDAEYTYYGLLALGHLSLA